MKALIKSQMVDLACLLETKIEKMSNKIMWSLKIGGCIEWGTVKARGPAEGVLVF